MIQNYLPGDVTQEEVQILSFVAVSVYKKVPDPIDKFIVAAVFELGYPQGDVAKCLGISDAAVHNRIDKIKKLLEEAKKPALVW